MRKIMAEQNLIFFDVDGTLLDASGQLPASAKSAILRAQKKGNLCFVNTGRPFSHLVPAVRAIPFDGYICSCGQYILIRNQPLVHAGFTHEEAQKIASLVRLCNMDVIYEGEDGVWYDHLRPRRPEILRSMEHFTALGFDVHRSIDADDFHFDKFCVWVQPDSNKELLLASIRSICTVIEREGNLLELVRIGYSKETGIQTVIDYLGIPIDRTYALGDSTNDLPMLHCTAHSIVMGNAPSAVKQTAEYVTQTAENDGVAAALAHYGLI